jgi:hypothetical protein
MSVTFVKTDLLLIWLSLARRSSAFSTNSYIYNALLSKIIRNEEGIEMAEWESGSLSEVWKIFLRKHWKMLALGILAIALICIGAVLVFLWFVGYAQSIALVPATLGLWSMGYLVTFILHLIFWEIVFIVIPVIVVAALAYMLWWKKLPLEERMDYRRRKLFSDKRSSATGGGGGGASFLIFVVFCIMIWTDGNWNMAFQDWTFDYLVYTYLWAMILVAIIFGIPILIGVTWWLRREMRKTPAATPIPIPQPPAPPQQMPPPPVQQPPGQPPAPPPPPPGA